jgi:hypothetical protein
MTPKGQEHFKGLFSRDAEYGYTKFKADAEAWITRLYNGVQVGRKAVFVPGNNSRRNADILVCEQFRRYTSYDFGVHNYHEGVAFYSGRKRTENFPKQHSENCTAKHQATNGNFKAMVRIFKNMRNTMIEKGLLADGVAPSYFIEGMPERSVHRRLRRHVDRVLQLGGHGRRIEVDDRERSPLARPRGHVSVLAIRELPRLHGCPQEVLGKLTWIATVSF